MINVQIGLYTAVSVFLSGSLALLAILLSRRRSTPGSRALACLAGLISACILAAGLEPTAQNLTLRAVWVKIEYLGLAASPIFLVQFALDFTQNHAWLTRTRRAALWALSGLAGLAVLTNDLHSLVWLPSGQLAAGAWVIALYLYAVYLGVLVLFVRTANQYTPLFRRKLSLILVCLLFPWVGLAAALIYPRAVSGLYLVPQTFAVALAALAWGLDRLGLFDIEPVARGRALEWLNDPLIVLDNNHCILDLNPAVRTVLLTVSPAPAREDGKQPVPLANLIGRSVDDVFRGWPEFISRLHLGSEGVISPPQKDEQAQKQSFDLRILVLKDQGGRKAGKIVLLHDITSVYMVQEEVARTRNLADALRFTGPAISSLSDVHQALEVLMEQVNRVIAFDCASFQVVDGSDLVITSVRGFRHPEILIGTRRSTRDEWPGEQITRLLQPAILENLQDHPNLFLRAFAGSILSGLAIPVAYQNHLTGLLMLYSSQPNNFTPDDIAVAQIFTSQVAFMLENTRLEEKIVEMTTTDYLTGLTNRKNFFTLSELEFIRSRRYGKAFIVLLMDIDHLKQINEIYGQHTGDLVLVEVGQICLNAIRKVDILGRYDGEEFALLLPETGPDVGLAVARRLHHRLTDQLLTTQEGTSLQVSVSIGVAWPVYQSDTIEIILDRADQALRVAKRSGGNQVRAYERITAP